MGKKHGPEEIIGKLREAEIVLAQGGTTGDACRRIAVTSGMHRFKGLRFQLRLTQSAPKESWRAMWMSRRSITT